MNIFGKKNSPKFFLLVFFILVIVPVFYFIFNLFFGFWNLKEAGKDLQQGKFRDLKTRTDWASSSFGRLNPFFFFGQPVFRFLGIEEKTRKAEKLILLAETTSETLGGSPGILTASGELFGKVMRGEKLNLPEKTSAIKNNLKSLYEKISYLQTLLANFSGKEMGVGSYLERGQKEIPYYRSLVWQAVELVETLPEILAAYDKKTYLLLFQNNMELRPTGGFLGSYGLLTFDHGSFVDLEIHDVYFADGQLRGHVEPPPKLAEFLGQAGWYLRDSNWDPDFPTSSARAEWFLEKEIGRQVDGVVALDLFVIERLLNVFGSIKVLDYEEEINSQNLFERAQFRAEVGFFPGSTGKRDFLSAVALSLFERIKTASLGELVKMGLMLHQSLSEKDLLFSFHEAKAARIVEKFNWDGAIKETGCSAGGGCFEDYLFLVEANVGINKANYYLKRQINLGAEIDKEGQVIKKLILTYQNLSPNEIFPAGPYKNYLRVYVSPESNLGECFLTNPQESQGSQECSVEEFFEHQRKVFAFLVNVPVGQKREVNLTWSTQKKTTEGWYRLFWQKQPGTRNDPLSLSFAFPANFSSSSEISVLTGRSPLLYNTSLSQDRIFDLKLKEVY